MEKKEDNRTNPEESSRGGKEIPSNAFLIINGVKVIPLQGAVVSIGRRLENDVVIDDLRVSRYHAQLRAVQNCYIIFDLDSTGGTYVNGQRITQCALSPGDLIWLAGITILYGQDNPPPRPDVLDTKSPEDFDANQQAAKRHTLPFVDNQKK